MMKVIRRLLAAVVLVGGLTTTVATAAPCAASASFDTFMALGATGCTVGNIHLSNFGLVSTANPAGNAIPATSINLSFDNSVPGQLAMTWNMGMSVTGLGFQDLFFTFNAAGNNVMFIRDTLSFNGAAIGPGASTGVTANICTVPGPLNTCPAESTYQTAVFNPPTIFTNSVSFDPTSTLSFSKDANVNVGIGGTSANMSSFTDTIHYSQVPETSTFILFGAGLISIAGIRKKK